MSERVDVTDFINEVAPQLTDKIEPNTKEMLGYLLDSYAAAGWTPDDLATVMAGQVSLHDATPEEFDGAVTVVSEAVMHSGETGQQEQHAEAPAQTGQQPNQTDDPEATLEELAVALAEDTVEAINAASADFIARSVAELWQQVREQIEQEVRADPENSWPTKEAAFEAAYTALIGAVDGFFESGESEGGFAALLGRPQS